MATLVSTSTNSTYITPFMSRFFDRLTPVKPWRQRTIMVRLGASHGVCRPSDGQYCPPEHRHPKMRPQTPRKDKSTAHRATHSATMAREGGTQGEASSVSFPETIDPQQPKHQTAGCATSRRSAEPYPAPPRPQRGERTPGSPAIRPAPY